MKTKIRSLLLLFAMLLCMMYAGTSAYAAENDYIYYGSFSNIDNIIDYFDKSVISDESFVKDLFVSESVTTDTSTKKLIDINTIIPGNTYLSFSSPDMENYVAYFLVPVNKVSNFDLKMGDGLGLALDYLNTSNQFVIYRSSSEELNAELFNYNDNDYMCLRTKNLSGASFGATFYFKNLANASDSPKGLSMVSNPLSGFSDETKKIIELSGKNYEEDYIYYGSIYNSNIDIQNDFAKIAENPAPLFVDEDNYFGCGNYCRISITDLVSNSKNYSFSIDKSMYYVNYFLLPVDVVSDFSTSNYLRLLCEDGTYTSFSDSNADKKGKKFEHDGKIYVCAIQRNFSNYSFGRISFSVAPKSGTTVGYIEDADYSDETVTANINMVKADVPASAYLALYKNNKLLNVFKTDISKESSRFKMPVNYKLADNQEYLLKLMLMDDNLTPVSVADSKVVTSDTVDYLYYGSFSGIDNVVSYFDNAVTSDEEFIKELFVSANTSTETSEKNRVDISTLVSGTTKWTFSGPEVKQYVAYFLVPVNKIKNFKLTTGVGFELLLSYLKETNSFGDYRSTSTTMTPKLFSYAGNNYICLRSNNLSGAEYNVTLTFVNA